MVTLIFASIKLVIFLLRLTRHLETPFQLASAFEFLIFCLLRSIWRSPVKTQEDYFSFEYEQ